MGDSLWATPGLRALKKSFSDCHISLLLDTRWKVFFNCNPYVDRIFDYKKQWYRQITRGMRLFPHAFDHTLIFHGNKDIRRFLFWIRSDKVWTYQPFPWLKDEDRIILPPTTHEIDRRRALLECIGAKHDGGDMEIFYSGEEKNSAKEFMTARGLHAKEFVYFNLGGSRENRRWPLPGFLKLTKKFLDQTEFPIVFGSGPGEEHLPNNLMSHFKNHPKLMKGCSELKLDSFVIGQARLMVTADTGPMHLALAQKVPTVSLFPNTDPALTGPYDPTVEYIRIILPTPNGEENEDKGISPKKVWEKCHELLELSK